ncbi:MAG: EamA domain-containing membrane protein RarD [Oleispira sp.]|jgi:EamA domain-containing membrane protein RarD
MNHSSIDNANKQGFAFAIGAALLFSCKPIIIKWAYDPGSSGVFTDRYNTDSETTASATKSWTALETLAWRCVCRFIWELPRKVFGFKRLRAGKYSIRTHHFICLAPLVVIWGAIIFKHKVTRQQISALALCYAGIICIVLRDLSLQGEQALHGCVLILLSALSYAIYYDQ